MHDLIKHIVKNIGISLLFIITVLISTHANSEQSAEDIIKIEKLCLAKTIILQKKFNLSLQAVILTGQRN